MLIDKDAEFQGIDILDVIEASFDGIIICDSTGKTLFVNSAAERIMGIVAAEIIGKDSIDLQKAGIISYATSQETLRTRKPFTTLQTYRNDRTALVSSNIIEISHKAPYVIINVRDITMLSKGPSDSGDMDSDSSIICKSREMKEVFDIARSIAPTEATVLLQGETGVGKDVIAQLIHTFSNRKERRFVKINCGTLPEQLMESELFGYDAGAFTGAVKGGKAGLVEYAEKSTLFLDEIGEMPLSLQPKLLELLQDFKFNRIGSTKKMRADIRVIASTNKNLKELVAKKQFRDDLFYRLNVIPIEIPPLRDRPDDIIPLINNYLQLFNRKYHVKKRVAEDAYHVLLSYGWPGNIRELANCIERLVVTSCKEEIRRSDLPDYMFQNPSCDESGVLPDRHCTLKEAVEFCEKEMISRYLDKGYTTEQIGRFLGVNQSTISRKIARYFSG